MTLRVLSGLVCAVLLVGCPSIPASGSVERPKIGLVLSGGGARGAAHVGVLRVLEEYRVPIDYIAGTSMGAIVAGLYASGYTVDELESVLDEIDWADVFDDRTRRRGRSFRRKRDDDLFLVRARAGLSGEGLKLPPGVLDGQKIDLVFKRYFLPVTTVRDFDDLPIPYRAVAADLTTGEAVVLAGGDLALAVRASMSIPIVFAPREIDGRLLVDGGISANLPVGVVRRMGAEVVIAVDISTPLEEREQLRSLADVAGQLTTILTRRNTDRQIDSLNARDVFIRPDLGDITTASFDRAADAVPAGEKAARLSGDRLAVLSVPEADFRAVRPGGRLGATPPAVDTVRIVNRSRVSDGVIRARLDVDAGKPLDVDRLERDIGRVYGLELFESVYYDVEQRRGRNVLTVTARERSWGPGYLQFGVVVYDDYESPNFNIAAAYTRTAVNRLNGEWRTGLQFGQEPGVFTEFFQPLDRGLRKFGHLRLFAGEQAWNVFDGDGNKLSELGLRRYGFDAALGRELGTWGEVRAGVFREGGTIRIQTGEPGLPDTDLNTGEAYAQLYVDELDDVRFPSGGGTLRVRYSNALEALGSDTDYEQWTASGSFVFSPGGNTVLLAGSFETTRGGEAPVHRLFRLGGFTRLSGYELNELSGRHTVLLAATLYRRLWDSPVVPGYAGISLEYGNVFQARDDIKWDNGLLSGSAFLGLDTPVGPAYFAWGAAEGGRNNYYLILGRPLGLHRTGLWN